MSGAAVDDDYVQEILRDMPAGLDRAGFRARCQHDVNGGYAAEVEEATRRYFTPQHEITRSLVKGSRISTLRARCSCGHFTNDVPRLSAPGRRKQDRLISEHLTSAAGAVDTAALLGTLSIEAML